MARFLLDVMCGGLPAYLRMCGHDAAYALDRGIEADDRLLQLAREEDRVLVTRDRQLAARADDGLLLTATDPADQLAELADAGVDLTLAEPPVRCGRCNGRLAAVDPGAETPAYVPDEPGGPTVDRTSRGTDADASLWQCADCGQYFWKGSHWERVRETLAAIE